MINLDLIFGIATFALIVNLMIFVILFARSRLVSTGDVIIEINGDQDKAIKVPAGGKLLQTCLLYTSPSPRDLSTSRMPSSA